MITNATETEPFKNYSNSLSSMDSPHRIFSHGSSIVKTNVHSNHIRHFHKNAPSAEAGGRSGSDRDVMTVTVDGAVQDFPSLEESEARWVNLPIERIRG